MRKLAVLLSFAGLGLMAQSLQQPSDWQALLNQGVQAFKSGHYDDAIAAFQKSADLNPSSIVPRLYLATAYMQKFIPGSATPEMRETASKAEAEFQRVLAMDPNNKIAMASLGSLNLNEKKWDQARDWYQRLIDIDPNNRDAYYTLGFIAWSQWYPAYSAARSRLGMRPEDPGPLPEGALKHDLQNQYTPVIEGGLANLRRALEIDPKYADAMAYMNLLIRERADLRSSRQEYAQDIAEADQWVNQALAAKKEKAQSMGAAVPAPPVGTPSRITIGSNIMESKLVSQLPPVYPELARQAQIQGAVTLTIVVAKDGSVANIQVNSGHPLLIPAAIDAVKQWKYQPTLLNGEPVEVQTTVNVNFTLPE